MERGWGPLDIYCKKLLISLYYLWAASDGNMISRQQQTASAKENKHYYFENHLFRLGMYIESNMADSKEGINGRKSIFLASWFMGRFTQPWWNGRLINLSTFSTVLYIISTKMNWIESLYRNLVFFISLFYPGSPSGKAFSSSFEEHKFIVISLCNLVIIVIQMSAMVIVIW